MNRRAESARDDDPSPRDHFLELVDGPEVETRVKGSRFVGQALAVASEGEAVARLQTIRKRAHDATHHCSAWVIGRGSGRIERSDDDGEPSGTAGAPILHPLVGSSRTNGMVVVTRWFGGTKLGAGGLVRAYGESAKLALEAAGARRVWITTDLVVTANYDDLGVVEAVLARNGASIHAVDRAFEAIPRFHVRLLESAAARVHDELIEATAGRARVETSIVDDGDAS